MTNINNNLIFVYRFLKIYAFKKIPHYSTLVEPGFGTLELRPRVYVETHCWNNACGIMTNHFLPELLFNRHITICVEANLAKFKVTILSFLFKRSPTPYKDFHYGISLLGTFTSSVLLVVWTRPRSSENHSEQKLISANQNRNKLTKISHVICHIRCAFCIRFFYCFKIV